MGSSACCMLCVQGAATHSTGSAKSRGSQRMPERSRMTGVPRPPAARTTRSAGRKTVRPTARARTPTARPPRITTFVTRHPVRRRAPLIRASSRKRRLSHLAPCGQPRTQRPQRRHRPESTNLGVGSGASPMSRLTWNSRHVRGDQLAWWAMLTGTSRASSPNSRSRSMPISRSGPSMRRALPVESSVVPPVAAPFTMIMPSRPRRTTIEGKARRMSRSSNRRPQSLRRCIRGMERDSGRNSRPASRIVT
jgi:hypothetical protein